MSRWERCLEAARTCVGRSVVALAPGAEAARLGAEDACPSDDALRLGIKDTAQIGDDLREGLASQPGIAWLTVDRAAPGGRAIDPGLTNPLTGRPMTGSTSGGPVNILAGFLDACIGTDGGGSILGPALATGLVGIVGSGLGLVAPGERTSTDGLTFRPGYGVIGRDWNTAARAFAALLQAAGTEPGPVLAGAATTGAAAAAGTAAAVEAAAEGAPTLRGLRVAVPAAGSVTLPDGADMARELEPYLQPLRAAGASVLALPMSGIAQRERALAVLREAFAQGADLVATLEGPVDVYGLGDSIVGSLGAPGRALQDAGGKYLLRAANMAGATAVALPVPRLASGLVLCGPPGQSGARSPLAAAALLAGPEGPAALPNLVRRYFPPL